LFLKKWTVAALGMLYEKVLTSFEELMKAARVLDEDSGIRLIGRSGGRRCLVFVTRYGSRFTMMTYTVKAGGRTPGRRISALEFDSAQALAEALSEVATSRIRAYVY
jgi:hypothetical protein